MEGFLLIDKPAGMTSFDVVRRVRRATGCRKIGHGGTLDPMATGLLPLALGRGTRLLEYLSDGDKAYLATVMLGVTTDTLDAEGEVLERKPVPCFDREQIESACEFFRGQIEQVPPMYSALKHQGQPLYKLARSGRSVERAARQVTIHRLEVDLLELPTLELSIACSKGTYIRTLAADLGDNLGTGAHLTALRRTEHGPFRIEAAIGLEDVEDHDWSLPFSGLLPLTMAFAGWPRVELDGDAKERLRQGIPPTLEQIRLPAEIEPGTRVVLLTGEPLFATARFEPERPQEKRGDFKLLKVFHP
ncbi:MAG: tRNA pseudouridine(55) synthase TruB [Desulfuromonas sp.]|nr:MAG: tRNA pseudouridine(55) synthase TruB [Desulfuromonas sp.]